MMTDEEIRRLISDQESVLRGQRKSDTDQIGCGLFIAFLWLAIITIVLIVAKWG